MPLDGDKVRIIPYRKGKRYGFVNKHSGKLVIPCTYHNVYQVFKEGAIVGGSSHSEENLRLLINNKGDTVILTTDMSLVRKENGLIHFMHTFIKEDVPKAMNSRAQVYVMDSNFKMLIDMEVNDYGFFTENDSIAWFRLGPDVSILNRKGQVVKKIKHTEQKQFTGIRYNQLSFREKINDTTFYVLEDLQGNRLISFQQYSLHKTWNGPYPISDNLYGFIDDEGTIVFKDSTGIVFPFISNFNIHQQTVAREITNFLGNGFFSSEYNFYWDTYHEYVPLSNYYVVRHNEKNGIINKMGKLIIPDSFDFAQIIDSAEFLLINRKENRLLSYFYSNPTGKIEAFSLTDSNQMNVNSFLRIYKNNHYHTLISNPFSHFMYARQIDENNIDQFFFHYNNLRTKKKYKLPKGIIWAENFDSGLALILDSNRKIGFMDTNYQMIIPCKYPIDGMASKTAGVIWSHKFVNDYCYISALKGYIDINGKEYFEGDLYKPNK